MPLRYQTVNLDISGLSDSKMTHGLAIKVSREAPMEVIPTLTFAACHSLKVCDLLVDIVQTSKEILRGPWLKCD